MNRQAWLAFAALCLLAGTAPVFDSAVPVNDPLPGLLGAGVRLGLLSLLFALLALRTSGRWGGWPIAVWGGILSAALPVAFAGASGHVSGPTQFLVFALLPAAIVFLQAQRRTGFGADQGPFALLLPALAGLGGSALLLSYAIPASPAGKLWLGLMVGLALVSAFAIIKLHEALSGLSTLRAASLICAAATVVCLVFSWLDWQPLPPFAASAIAFAAARLFLLDVPLILLTIWLLPRFTPVAFSARYLLALLIAVTESFLMARPGLSWTIGLGALLVAGGSIALLREPAPAA